MERTPQPSLAFARSFAAARARAAERNFFLEAVGNECVDVDVNTRDEAEVEGREESRGREPEAFGR